METQQQKRGGRRVAPKRRRSARLPVALAAIVVALVALMAAALGRGTGRPGGPAPTPPVVQTPEPTPTPIPTPTPEPTPTPMDFSQPVAESPEVEMDYFSDAVFIGDSRTDGFQLYSGVEGADFLSYNGLMVVEVNTKRVIKTSSGEKVTIPTALAWKQYGKVYISLGVNELGYGDNDAYEQAYLELIDTVRSIQPNAVIYIQTLAPVNPEVGRKHGMARYVTNEQIDIYNEILHRVAEEKKAALVDVYACFAGEDGILAAEYASDGVHMTRPGYQVWLKYLMCHVADGEAYWAGQSVAE